MNTIYQITNLVNGKAYIGQTWQSIEARLKQHFNPSNQGCRKLGNAIRKYGQKNFKTEPICQVDNQQDADSLEVFLIASRDTINNGYNLMSGGMSCGRHHAETILKISLANVGKRLGRHQDEEWKEKKVVSLRGRKRSKEVIDKIRASWKIRSSQIQEKQILEKLKFRKQRAMANKPIWLQDIVMILNFPLTK